MAKGTGLIGNFKGKVGNMVGYNLKDSNNKQTQGIRVYQPVVRNPKTYAQATQRCIMKPINDFYRALKPIISRGYEGKAYGNASRLAWLKNVMKTFNGPWLVKGSAAQWPIACQVTAGSLPSLAATCTPTGLIRLGLVPDVASAPTTIGDLFTAIKSFYPTLKSGDQFTLVTGIAEDGNLRTNTTSFILVEDSNEAVSGFSLSSDHLAFADSVMGSSVNFGTAIISRESSNGGHLRSTETIALANSLEEQSVYDATLSKQAAVMSYMTTGGNVDWPEEGIDPDFQ